MRVDAISQRIAALRVSACDDLAAQLLHEVSDQQGLTDALGQTLQVDVVRLNDLALLQPAFDELSFAECAARRCGLLADAATGERRFVVTDPFDVDLVAWARTRFGVVEVALASQETFEAWLAQAESGMTALSTVSVRDDTAVGGAILAEDLNLRQIGADHSPAIRFVNSTLYDALKTGASDIHLEGDPAGLGVKFRIDGVLTAIRRVDSPELATQTISRIKVMAQLDIAERRLPQDGRLQIGYRGRSVDVRVSIMPSIHGEDAVLRILDREHLAQSLSGLTLAKLGFDSPTQQAIRHLCARPHGMLLVTGPTGSGKTTTLYAAIAETHQSRDKIITIEDPVEYQLPGVLQIPVNERKGLTFAKGLRSILRHDPDKILVGEIRDAETAGIAVQSALTGHLVFTTVHANSVFDVVGRFDQFGIDAYTFASAVNGVLAQRLLRRLCTHCAISAKAEVDSGVSVGDALPLSQHVLVARGCEHCRGTGYLGRFALGEILQFTPTLKDMIARRASQVELQKEAQNAGWRSLREQALDAAARGATTLEEVDRVAL
jgi:general secretion pathway protein E